MNNLTEIIQKYEARTEFANSEAKKIQGQITLAKHEAEKFAKKSEDMLKLAKKWEDEERRIYFPDWKTDIVDKLAKALAEKTGLQWAVHEPGGIASRCYILLYEDAEQRPRGQKHNELVVQPDFDENKVFLVYETGEITDRYKKGTVGYVNGMNYKTARLPDDFDEILALFTKHDPI